MKPQILKTSFITLFMMLSMPPARADYHYVSHAGSDTYPYTSWETAADSIQPAINAASPGDTVYAGAGVWEDGPYNLWDDLSLIGMGIDSTIISAPRTVWYFTPRKRTSIEHLTIDGQNLNPNRSVGIYPIYRDTAVFVNNCRFTNLLRGIIGTFTGQISNNQFINCEGAIDGSFNACSLLVRNNIFTGGTMHSLVGGSGSNSAAHWTVVNNLFHHNPMPSGDGNVFALGMFLPGDSGYVAGNLFYRNFAGRRHFVFSNVIVENNTMVGFPENPVNVGIVNGDSMLALRNNVVSGFQYAIDTYPESTTFLYYNCIWSNRYLFNLYPPDTIIGNIFQNPMFVDTSDYHLQAFSPCIDAGDPAILDLNGSRSDIGYLGGPYGASYSYMDLAPRAPDSLNAAIRIDTAFISWRFSTESDFNRYQLFRDTVSGFTPSVFNLIAEPETSLYVDINLDTLGSYFYKIAALDNQDNLSDYSNELAVVFTGIPGFGDTYLPKVSYIEKNYPNPFNSVTIINYHLADLGYQPAEVHLIICDIGGRLIKTLLNQRQYPGDYRASWDGRDEGGEAVTSGVYFARLIVSGVELQRALKILLVK
jgi:hypothetical protein